MRLLFSFLLLGSLALAGATHAQKRTAFEPGQPWPDNHGTGGYSWLPLTGEGDQPRLRWADRWSLGAFNQPQPQLQAAQQVAEP